MKQTVQFNYNNNNTAAMKTFDMIQEELECCGLTGPKSWKKSVFNEYNFQGEDLGITTTKSYYNVPKSCCRAPETSDCFNNLKLDNNQIPSEARLYKAGCGAALTAVISQHLVYLLGAGAALLVMGRSTSSTEPLFNDLFLEIFGMLCSLWLCCAVKRIEDMKA